LDLIGELPHCRRKDSLLLNLVPSAMPTYEYECEKCHQTFEVFQSMSAERLTGCPQALCKNKQGWGKGTVKRLLGTGAGIIFKGSGFYSTDYRSSGYKEAAKKDSSTSTPAASPKETKPAPPVGGASPTATAP
jgi:putative FmdB family regulatory protein